MVTAAAVDTFNKLKESGESSDRRVLDQIFAALDPVPLDFMTGSWRGGALPSGHPLDVQLGEAGWHGKTFNSPADVEPLICRDADGNLFSNKALGRGEASLWMVEYQGVSTASMVYDGQPVIDHFKMVDDSTVMGIMNGKSAFESGMLFYFYLVRE